MNFLGIGSSPLSGLELVMAFVVLVLVYFISVIPAGYFQAWVAKKMGDPTGEQYGFLSLQPLVYIDFFGFLCMFLFRFGWGNRVPVNRYNITGSNRMVKFLCAYFAGVFAHIMIAMVGLILVIVSLGVKSPLVILNLISSSVFSLGQSFSQSSSLSIAVGTIGIKLFSLNLILGTFRLISNAVDYFFMTVIDVRYPLGQNRFWGLFFVTIMTYILLGNVISLTLYRVIFFIATLIAKLLGA